MQRLAACVLFLGLVPLAHAIESISRVQSWSQLKAAPVLEIKTPAGVSKVRLGIEYARVVKGRTVAIFALVEGPLVKPHEDEYEEQLGPLVVRAIDPEEIRALRGLRAERREAVQADLETAKKPFHFYAMLIPIRSDRSVVKATLPRSEEYLAETEVAGDAGWTHPWTRLRLPDLDGEPEEPQTGIAGVVQGDAVYADWEPAYPRLDGSTPLASFTAAELAAVNGPLPYLEGPRRNLPLPDFPGAEPIKGKRPEIAALIPKLGDAEFETREKSSALLHALLPEALSELKAARFSTVDPEARSRLEALLEAADATAMLKLKAERDEWTLQFPKKREFGRYSSPEKILVRWWINGRPVVKKSETVEDELHRAYHERIEPAATWKIAVRVDYAWLGARHGDTVSVQVLYAPAGVRPIDEQISVAPEGIDCEGGALPVLSNVSSFIYKRK